MPKALGRERESESEVTAYSLSATSHLKLLNDYLPVNLIVISDREKNRLMIYMKMMY